MGNFGKGFFTPIVVRGSSVHKNMVQFSHGKITKFGSHPKTTSLLFAVCQRMLAQLVRSSGGISQVLSSNLMGADFRPRVKKTLARPRPKHRLRDGSGLGSSCAHRLRDDPLTEFGSLCMDRAEVRGFSRSV
jgi:hypothetical protein